MNNMVHILCGLVYTCLTDVLYQCGITEYCLHVLYILQSKSYAMLPGAHHVD